MKLILSQEEIQEAIMALVQRTVAIREGSDIKLTTNKNGELEVDIRYLGVTSINLGSEKSASVMQVEPAKEPAPEQPAETGTSRRGRPPGSKNKPKNLFDNATAPDDGQGEPEEPVATPEPNEVAEPTPEPESTPEAVVAAAEAAAEEKGEAIADPAGEDAPPPPPTERKSLFG